MTTAVLAGADVRGNVQAIRHVVAAIEADLKAWDQERLLGRGECGTARCLAGWAIHVAGYDLEALLAASPIGQGYVEVIELARALLGLTQEQADDLFLVFGLVGKKPTIGELKARITAVTGVTFP